jgi:hypothetical protein
VDSLEKTVIAQFSAQGGRVAGSLDLRSLLLSLVAAAGIIYGIWNATH